MSDDSHLMETGRLAELGLQASTLVHELRQPVFAIKAMVQLVAESPAGSKDEHLKDLITQVEVLEGLLSRYGDSSRRPTGASSPVDLSRAVASGVQVVQGHRSEINIVTSLPEVAVWGRVDPVALQQITSNLVRNAVDAARQEVVVRLVGSSLTVEDDGEGILPEIEERLCQPFVTSKPLGEGTGLGLAVTRSLVDGIGGDFSWTTGPTGTCFTVELSDERRDKE